MIFQHGGTNAGYGNFLTAFAYSFDAAIVMCNGDNARPFRAEVIRAISNYYGWGSEQPTEMEFVNRKSRQLDSYSGKYLYQGDVSNRNGAFFEISTHDSGLEVKGFGAQGWETPWELRQIDANKFIDINSGNEFVFNNDSTFVLSGQFLFKRTYQ